MIIFIWLGSEVAPEYCLRKQTVKSNENNEYGKHLINFQRDACETDIFTEIPSYAA